VVLAYNIIQPQSFFWIGKSFLFTVSVFGRDHHFPPPATYIEKDIVQHLPSRRVTSTN